MALNCSSDTLAVPALFGGEVLAFDFNLVENYNATAHTNLYYGHPTVKVENANFCNVTVTYTHPEQNDTIHVETWLPIDNFNGRLQAIGGGGWVAGRYPPSLSAMAGAMAEGYATTTTDAGLTLQADYGPDEWALLSEGNPNYYLLNNFASVSLNDQAIIVKEVIEAFYGQPPSYSYWSGCSQGGRQGMMLAQRYPDAYDGIHACAPAIFWNELFMSTFWPQLFMDMIGYFPYPCELNALTAAAVEACDDLDGINDGIIANDAACHFDPISVVGKHFFCPDTNKTMSISEGAAMVANATWSGARLADGEFAWYGPNVGSQLSGSTATLTSDIGTAMTSCSNNDTCIGVPIGLGEVWIQYWIESRAGWSYEDMTHEDFQQYFHTSVQQYDSVIGTNDPDLRAFYEKGGKILGYHGMSDQIIPVKGSERYLDMVAEVIPTVDEFYRMFEVPGLLHCSGGPGGQPSNTFDALRAWVENGTAPDALPHSYTPEDGGTEQHRLLCPYPKKTELKRSARTGPNGTHQIEDFECV